MGSSGHLCFQTVPGFQTLQYQRLCTSIWSYHQHSYFTPAKNKQLNTRCCSARSSQRWAGPTDGFAAKAQACSTKCYFWLSHRAPDLSQSVGFTTYAFPSSLLHEVQSNLPSQKRTGKFPPFKVPWNHMEITEHIKSISVPGSRKLHSVFHELLGAVLAGAAVLPSHSQTVPFWQCSLSGCYWCLCDKQAQGADPAQLLPFSHQVMHTLTL